MITSTTPEALRNTEAAGPDNVPKSERLQLSRFQLGTFSLLSILLAAAVGEKVLETPFWSYNGTRLLPSFFLLHGITIYSNPHTGSLQSSLYGPITALTYLPTVLMRTPNAAVLLGSVLTVTLCYGAALWMHVAASRGQSRMSILPFLATGFMILYLEPLQYSCIRVHADAPGLFFGALAILAVCDEKYPPLCGLLGSAIFAIFSVWAKQPFIGVPIGLCIFIAITQGRRRLVQYVSLLVLAGIAVGAIFVWIFGLHELYFNLLWMPAHQPWKNPSKTMEMFQSFRWMTSIFFPIFVGLAASVMYLANKENLNSRSLGSFAAGKIWFASLLVGICQVPFSLLGVSKLGGDINSFSFSLFFLLLALMLLLQDGTISATSTTLYRVSRASILALMFVAMSFTVPFIALIPKQLRALPNTEQELAFRYIRVHPGQVYFPWFPLVHWMGEHADYNAAYGLWDHASAGIVPTEQEFRNYMPPSPKAVAFGNEGGIVNGMNIMSYLPEFRCVSHNPELPGFIVLTKIPVTGSCRQYQDLETRAKPTR